MAQGMGSLLIPGAAWTRRGTPRGSRRGCPGGSGRGRRPVRARRRMTRGGRTRRRRPRTRRTSSTTRATTSMTRRTTTTSRRGGKWCCSPRWGRGELQGEERASERLDAIDDVGEAQSGKFSEDVGEASGETPLGLRRRRRRRSRRRRSSPGAKSFAASRWARRLCRRRVGAGSDVGGGSTTLAPLTKTNSRGSAGVARGVTLGLAIRGSRGQPVS